MSENDSPTPETTGDTGASVSFPVCREKDGAADYETSDGEATERESIVSAAVTEPEGPEATDGETSSSTLAEEAFPIERDNCAREMEETRQKSYEELLEENEELRHLLDSKTSQITELEGNYRVILDEKTLMSQKVQDVQKSANEENRKLELEVMESRKINEYLQEKAEKLKTGIKELNQMMFDAIFQLNSNGIMIESPHSTPSPSLEPLASTSTALVPFTGMSPSYQLPEFPYQCLYSSPKLNPTSAANVPREATNCPQDNQTKENEETTLRRSQRVSAFSTQIQRCLESIPPTYHTVEQSSGKPEVEVSQPNKSGKRILHALDTQREGSELFCICGMSFFSNARLKNHIKYHTFQKMFRCTVPNCGRRFYATSYLKDHMKTHHGIIYGGREGCRRCGKTFLTRKQLQWHCKTAHNCGPCVPRSKNTQKDSSSLSSPPTTPNSSPTGKKILERAQAEANVGLIKKPSGPYGQQQQGDPELNQFEIPHKMNTSPPKDGRVHCICGRSFSAKSYLMMHIKYFSTEPKFKCQLCEKMYNHVNYLRVHMKFKHDLAFEGGSGCKLCGCIFKTRMAFNQHCKKVHPMDGSIGTSTPSPVVVQRNNLRRDRKIPAKYAEEPDAAYVRQQTKNVDEFGVHHSADLNCPMGIKCNCGTTFTSHSALLNHVSLKASGSSAGRHYEDAASYMEGSSSTVHGRAAEIKPGKNFPKCLCGARFPTEKALRKHIELQSRSTEFSCGICKDTFSRHEYLKIHLRKIHSLALPAGMSCSLCGCGGFKNSGEIKKHRKLYHNKDDTI